MIALKWNLFLNAWEMIDEHGFEMYIFRNCANINRLYKNLDKNKINWYAQEPLTPVKQEEVV